MKTLSKLLTTIICLFLALVSIPISWVLSPINAFRQFGHDFWVIWFKKPPIGDGSIDLLRNVLNEISEN